MNQLPRYCQLKFLKEVDSVSGQATGHVIRIGYIVQWTKGFYSASS